MRHVHTSGRQKIKSALWWLNGADHWTNIIALIQDHRRDEEDDFIWFIIEAILFLTTRLIQQKCDLFVHSCRGSLCRGSQRKSVRAWHCQTSSIITDPNSDPISSCLKSAHHICAYWTFRFLNTHTSRLTRQGQTDRATRRHKHTHTHTHTSNFTYCIFFRRDLQHIENNGIKTLLQVRRTLIAERLWAAAPLENTQSHKRFKIQDSRGLYYPPTGKCDRNDGRADKNKVMKWRRGEVCKVWEMVLKHSWE